MHYTVARPSLTHIKNFASNWLAKWEIPYEGVPVLRECAGITNVASGAFDMMYGIYYKHHSPCAYAALHCFEEGNKKIEKGFSQLGPAALCASVLVAAYAFNKSPFSE